MHVIRYRLVLPACLLLAACMPAPDPAAPAATETFDMALIADNEAWRRQRHDDLQKPDGWTSLVGLHWIELKAHYLGSSPGSGIRLALGPPRLALLEQEGGRLFLTPEAGVALTLDGAPLKGRSELRSDASTAPSVIGFDGGRGLLTVIERGGRHALRVKHADAAARAAFAGLEYWPVEPAWSIVGRFEPHAAGATIEIANILGMLEPMANPGAVVFRSDGREHRLEAVDQGDGKLFLIFGDRTNGHGSYGAGRYLDAGTPAADGSVVLDFNRAYNPPCAFTAYATCPLPPLENRLDLAVTAGEKAYAAGAH
jgi:uncharacterized protein